MASATLTAPAPPRGTRPRPAFTGRAALAALGVGVTAWAYWPVLRQMAERWAADPQFSHGWIVPFISAYLLWDRRAALSGSVLTPAWWGLPVTLAGVGAWAVGTVFYLTAVEAASLPLTLLGLVACWGGRAGVRWAWPGVGFLLFMAPLPYQVQTALGGQLRRLGTAATTYGLQTLGIPAVPEGNVIVLENGARLGVVEACSGLGMTMTFFALTAAAALLVRAEWWKRAAVVASVIPIAVAANVLRLVATGVVADHTPDKGTVDTVHDVAGWLMMPAAVGMIAAEFWVLNRVVVRRPVAG